MKSGWRVAGVANDFRGIWVPMLTGESGPKAVHAADRQKTPVRGRVPKHQSSGRGVSDFHDIAVCYIPSTVRLLLPVGSPAVRAVPPDDLASLHPSLGADLPLAV